MFCGDVRLMKSVDESQKSPFWSVSPSRGLSGKNAVFFFLFEENNHQPNRTKDSVQLDRDPPNDAYLFFLGESSNGYTDNERHPVT